jgi:hypothetical protein
MKGKLFYDHLIIIEEIIAVAGNDPKLLDLVDQTLQNEILDVIFTYLPREKHEEFLEKFHAAPHDARLMQYLKDNSPVNIELAILDRANKTKRKLLRHLTPGLKNSL